MESANNINRRGVEKSEEIVCGLTFRTQGQFVQIPAMTECGRVWSNANHA
jgi:hypothetical protein